MVEESPFVNHHTINIHAEKMPIPAAGYGTRFLPASKSMPKEMMPVVSKPLIEYGVEEALEANLAIIGRYILTPDIFDLIRDTQPGKGGEIQITDALMAQAQRGCVLAYKFKGRRFDCGSIENFIEATNYCYDKLYAR